MNSIVDYDSSDEEDEKVCLKRKSTTELDKTNVKLPKLPSFFDAQVNKKTLTSKDHQGRIRTMPHKEDSWATFVYFKVDIEEEMKELLSYIKGVEIIKEPHISLTKPIYLRKFQLDSFVNTIRNQIKDIESFDISFAQLSVLINDEKTRSFLTLEIGKGYNELFQCMELMDKIMLKYHKPTFYNPPRFHASIGWSLKEESINISTISNSIIENNLMNQTFRLNTIYIKMGHIIESISLL